MRIDDVMLMAYVDGEIDAATAREIERGLANDPAMAARVRALRDSATIARSAYAGALHEPVPDRLTAIFSSAVVAAAASATAVKPALSASAKVVPLMARRPSRQLVGWAMAASLAIAAVGVSSLFATGRLAPPAGLQFASSDSWLDSVAGFFDVYSGTLSREERQLVDFNAADIPELEKWFGARLQRKLVVPDLSSKGLTMQGGRLLIIDGKPAAQFIYNSASGELVGLVIAFTDARDSTATIAQRKDVNIVHWRKSGYAYAFVGHAEPATLRDLADQAYRDLDTI
jgi:anti-sigma factor RsiW